MSSCPGYTLEEFLAWEYNVRVIDLPEANVSVGMAEAFCLVTIPRPILTTEQFTEIVGLYEPYREEIEDKLFDFDEEEHGSWRTYGAYVVEIAPEPLQDQATALIKSYQVKELEA